MFLHFPKFHYEDITIKHRPSNHVPFVIFTFMLELKTVVKHPFTLQPRTLLVFNFSGFFSSFICSALSILLKITKNWIPILCSNSMSCHRVLL